MRKFSGIRSGRNVPGQLAADLGKNDGTEPRKTKKSSD